jgi:hypothetical protein
VDELVGALCLEVPELRVEMGRWKSALDLARHLTPELYLRLLLKGMTTGSNEGRSDVADRE